MWDAGLVWGGDLSTSATGDLLLASGADLGQQRLLRRLLTNPSDYMWQASYGAGLGQFVGQTNVAGAASGVIYSQIHHESSIAQQPVPQVSVTEAGSGSVIVGIQYVDVKSGQSQSLSFSMSI